MMSSLAWMILCSIPFVLGYFLGDYLGFTALGYIAYAFAAVMWLWFGFRFFFPVVFEIAIAGWKGILCIAYLTPQQAVEIVWSGWLTLRKDVEDVLGRREQESMPKND